MRAASTVLTLGFAAGLMTAGTAQALGFGRVVNGTQLGQRLNFGALVHLDADETLDRACVFAEVSAGDNLLQPGQVRVTLEDGPDRDERTVRVSTRTVIDEPVVSVNLTLGCSNARSSRRYVVFIDPPALQLAPVVAAVDSAAPATERDAPMTPQRDTSPMPQRDAPLMPQRDALLMPQRDDSPLAPLVALLAPEPPRRAVARRREATVDRGRQRQASVDTGAPASRSRPAPAASAAVDGTRVAAAGPHKPATATRRPAVVDKPPAAARLQLEAPALPVAAASAAQVTAAAHPAASAAAQSAVASTAAQVAAAGSNPTGSAADPAAGTLADAALAAAAEQQALLQRERQRVRLLEEGLARLQAEAADTRKTVAGLQARLQQAEAERDANPWVYALAVLSAALAALLVGVGWRRRQAKAAAPWWKVGVAASLFGRHSALAEPASSRLVDELPTETTDPASPPRSPAPLPSRPPIADAPPAVIGVDLVVPTAAETGATSRPLAAVGASAAATLPRAETPPADPSSVEELIDLEQQVEFFVVLGQDDAAIDLLSHHLQADGATSPLPYLKLLKIHRRRGDRVGYETIRVQFNRDFNAYAPGWDADLQQGHALEDYPEVVDRLQRHWGDPARAMELLEASLFRRGPTDTTFDLPAYRELLSLYSIARDQAQAGGPGAAGDAALGEVDLLLPLGGPPAAVPPIAWLNATTKPTGRPPAIGAQRVVAAPLDVDVTMPAGPEERPRWPARAKVAPAPTPVPAQAQAQAPRPTPKAPFAVPDDSVETVPAALRRPDGHPDESVFVDLVLEPIEVSVR